jgi:hypothetical protein
VYKSANGASSWGDASAGLPNKRILALAISPAYGTDQTIFASVYQTGVYKSTNGGASWSPATSGISGQNVGVLAISPGYASDRTIYAGTWDAGVYKSSDGAGSWVKLTVYPDELVYTVALAPDYASTGVLYAAFHRVRRSGDRGASWALLGTTPWQRYTDALAAAPGSPQVVFAVTDGESIWKYVGE